eukprot:COSAG05_NODE_483_length_9358_cov_36.727184_3_plen_60_part_00
MLVQLDEMTGVAGRIPLLLGAAQAWALYSPVQIRQAPPYGTQMHKVGDKRESWHEVYGS